MCLPCLIQQMVQHNIFTDCLKVTVPNKASEVVLCPILYCIDVFSTYLGKILDFVVVHWSFIFVSHVSRLIVEFIWVHMYIIVHAFAFLDTFFLLLLLVRCSTPIFRQQSRTFLLLCSTSQIFPCWRAIFFPWLTDSQTSPSSAAVWRSKASGVQLPIFVQKVSPGPPGPYTVGKLRRLSAFCRYNNISKVY